MRFCKRHALLKNQHWVLDHTWFPCSIRKCLLVLSCRKFSRVFNLCVCLLKVNSFRPSSQGWHIGIGRFEISADIAHIGKTDISVSVSIITDIYWPICNIGNLLHIGGYRTMWMDICKARISAIGQYIGYDKSISAHRLSVKFHRYANPASSH